MANTAAPYGLLPVKLIGGQVFAGSVRQLRIQSGYATAIFHGDLVGLSGGYVVKDTGTTSANPIGIFLGCEYVDAVSGLRHSQYFPASTAAPTGTEIFAYVCDDPDALFQVQSDEALDITDIGKNFALVQGSGSTATGKSAVALDGSTAATTATLPVRMIDFVSPLTDTYPDVLVKINTHRYNNATGV